jgi:spermidine synthase
MLALDGVVQCSEKDECVYQEMMTHLPLFCHPHPKTVLVIGGGDGGIVRELDKHSLVEKIALCEIDEEVIRVSKLYLPTMAVGFNSNKLDVHIGDGCEFMRLHQNKFDLIITDCSDPAGMVHVKHLQLCNACIRVCVLKEHCTCQ